MRMACRPEVIALVDLGPFPASADADPSDVQRRETLLNEIAPPLTSEEAAALLTVFGPDDAFGLAWQLMLLVETAPGGAPIAVKPGPADNEWIQRLWVREHG